ncbi:MAG: domain S-box/diguanylate cyclase protein [Proteobacteria bacterium]|nr:domain S-box/diguanylate cyclase protein [Pseudomonadota bacterium]
MVALAIGALLTYLGLVWYYLAQSHAREIEFTRHSLESLAKVLEGHTQTTIDKIDTVLQASRLGLERERAEQAGDDATINTTLQHFLALIGESQSLRVADKNGHFVFDATGKLATATITDRDYFLRNRNDASGRLVISEPIFARITSNWVITLSRRLNDPAGQFAGLVQAAVRADHFENFFTSLDLGDARSVALIDDQRRLIARYPAAPAMLGKALSSSELSRFVGSGQRQVGYTSVSPIDAIERLYVARQVGSYPLYVVVGHSKTDYLASWRQQVMWGALSGLTLALVLAGWIVVWLRTYDEARRLATGMTEAYLTTMQRTRALLDSLPDPAWLSDRNHRMIAVNEAYSRVCGRPPTQIIGHTVGEIWPAATAAALQQQDAAALSEQIQQRREATQSVAAGGERCFEYISTPVRDKGGRLIGVAGVARDITQIRDDQARIRHLAEYDILTDLPNRAQLNDRMAAALVETLGAQAEIALLFLDLDQFKDVNDTLGHELGDHLLLQVAQRLRNSVDERDTISRQGGDEFAVLLQHYGSLARVADIAQRLLDAIAVPFLVDGHELQITASIGISAYPQDGAEISTLLRNADTAMYQAKAAGGNAYQFFAPEMNTRIAERVALEGSLRRAIPKQELVLHYQPQVDGESGRLLGLEALVRWQHPDWGQIPPGRFIPIAEESNLINTIGEWVLREACRQSRAWSAQGYAPVVIAVNLSAVQLRQTNLAQRVAAILAETGLAPAWLELEITESAFIRDTERIVEMLGELRALGIKLSVDDFGTGYSSLGYLKCLPFDKIKIDQSFVRDLPGNADDAAITRAIIGIADSLQKEVIAEGVEHPAQRDFLLAHGCRQMQGYYFSRPQPAAAIEALLSRG